VHAWSSRKFRWTSLVLHVQDLCSAPIANLWCKHHEGFGRVKRGYSWLALNDIDGAEQSA
jgi:hypothetical protein